MKESIIERTLVKEVKKLGGLCFKITSPGNNGMPDRLLILPDRPPIFVELKAPGKKPRKIQEYQMRKLHRLNQVAVVISSLDGLSQFFQTFGFEETSKALDAKYDL